MTLPLAEQVTMITGASRGFGRALAHAYWRAGSSLIITARNSAALSELTSELERAGGARHQKIIPVTRDLAEHRTPSDLISTAESCFGCLDTLVVNAAVQGPVGRLWETDVEKWREALILNLAVPAALCAEAARLMVRQQSGTIIAISGGGATAPRPRFSSYAAAKAGLVRLIETLARELEGTGVTANAIAPGAMATDMLRDVLRTGPDAAGTKECADAARVLSEGDMTMERACDLAVFLATAAGSRVSGRLISAVWDRWEDWPAHAAQLDGSDLYTLRRVTGRDRGQTWGDY